MKTKEDKKNYIIVAMRSRALQETSFDTILYITFFIDISRQNYKAWCVKGIDVDKKEDEIAHDRRKK